MRIHGRAAKRGSNEQRLTFLNLGLSLALASSSSKYVRTPSLQSMTAGLLNSPSKSSSTRNSIRSQNVEKKIHFEKKKNR